MRFNGLPDCDRDLLDLAREPERRFVIERHRLAAVLANAECVDAEAASNRSRHLALSLPIRH